MGTNYYAFKKPTRKEEEEVISTINMQKYTLVPELVKEFYTDKKYHLGKKSYGWQFLWNSNREILYDYEKDGYFLSNDYLYEFNRKSIEEFLKQDDIIIYNEYGDVLSFEEFSKIAFTVLPEEWNIETSGEYGTSEYDYLRFKDYENDIYSDLGLRYSKYGSEFYNDEDNLRFSTYTEFS